MGKRNAFAAFFATIGNAIRAANRASEANAVGARRIPNADDLKALGIEPEQFNTIHR